MKNKFFSIFLCSLLMVSFGLFAQQKSVSGTVTDDQGIPLPGATVLVKGTASGAVTDFDGNYTIEVAIGQTIVISFVGYETEEITVSNNSTFDVTLQPSNALDEVVVTALGITREKKALAYSVTQVDGSKFVESRTANLGNALTGKVAGVNITPPASGAGGSTRITIRGGSSLGGNDQPLVVVNGVPLETGNFGQAGLWGGNDAGDGLSMINPDDIESLSVLKGNTAAALYGARAANGVILVTTKSGSARQGIGVSFNSNTTIDQVIDNTDFQNTYGQGINGEKFANSSDALDFGTSIWGERFDGTQVVQFDGVSRPYSHLGQSMADFYQPSVTTNNTVAFTGGNESGNYRFSLSDMSNKDIMPNASFTRRTASLNVNSKLDKFTIKASAQYNIQDAKNRPRLSDSPGNANYAIIALPANIPLDVIQGDPNKLGALEDGTELRYQGSVFATNPYWAAHQFFRRDVSNRLVGNFSVQYDFTDWLYVLGRVGTDFTIRDDASSEVYGTAYKPRGGYSESFTKLFQNNYDLFIGGQKEFGDFNIDYLLGTSQFIRESEQKGLGGNDLVVPFFSSVRNVSAATGQFGFSQLGQNSYFGSFNVGYQNWAFLNLTARQDTFSTLSPENNKAFYPSVGGSLVLSDAIELPEVISFAKFRASWAQVGGGGPDPYALNVNYGLLSAPHGTANLGQITNGSIPNPNLQPYTSTEFEIGGDFRFFNNRLGVDAAIYNRTTTNDILNAGISSTSGFGSTQVNIGELSNRGFEILIDATIIDSDTFKWNTSFNYSRNISEAVNLGTNSKGEPIEFLNLDESRLRGGERIRHELGEQLGVIYGYTWRRDANGTPFYDANGYPVRSAAPELLGYGRHPVSGGFSNIFSYKNMSLSMLIDFRSGGSIFSGTNNYAYRSGLHQETLNGRDNTLSISGLLFADNKETSTPINKTIPKEDVDNYWGSYAAITEHVVYDASFAKLREISLTYNVPKSIFGNVPVESVNLSLVGRNLALLFSNVPNIDPESGYTVNGGSQGLEYFAMPQTRNIGINLSATF
jgi:TonB-linked SusC/RagA family outer membrane protein